MHQIGNRAKLFIFSELFASNGGPRLSASTLKESMIEGLELYVKKNEGLVSVILPAVFPEKLRQHPDYQAWLEGVGESGYLLKRVAQESGPSAILLFLKFEVKSGDHLDAYTASIHVNSDKFFAPLQLANIYQTYLVSKGAEVLVQYDQTQRVESGPVVEHPLLKSALAFGGGTSGVHSFEQEGEVWYGAFAPVSIGDLFVLSQASRREVSSAITLLLRRSALFGLAILTVSFLVSILLSNHLAKNLRKLANGAKKVGEGDLNLSLTIHSRDEVEDVANTFNQMTQALRSSYDAIAKHNRELESRVAQRTQELQEANTVIKDTQEKLFKTTQLAAIGEVAGRTAHEILNPLTAILAGLDRLRHDLGATEQHGLIRQFTEIFSAWEKDFKEGGTDKLFSVLKAPSALQPNETLLEEDLRNMRELIAGWDKEVVGIGDTLQHIIEQAERIHRIVDSMRRLARSSSVKQVVHCHEEMTKAVASMRDYAHKLGVSIRVERNATEDEAILNSDEFIQVLTNLIRNSIQAIVGNLENSKHSKGEIVLRTSNGNDQLLIDIIDNGTGITQENQGSIFEQGFTTKSPDEGTGFGLAICRRYARAFSGDVILLESDLERGYTCFRVIVPVSKQTLKLAS